MTALGIALFVYSIAECKYLVLFRRSIGLCKRRLSEALETYKVPEDVSKDLVQQLHTMPHVRTFYRDLFECSHHSEIRQGNLENLFTYTMGVSRPMIAYLIAHLEEQLEHKFLDGINPNLHHAYSRDDQEVRGLYMPAIFKAPIVLLKWTVDWLINFYYEKIVTPNIIYWIHYRTCGTKTKRSVARVLVVLCGIGIGPITYYYLLKHFYAIYDVIIMVEIKWISFHLHAYPVEDRVVINDVASFLTAYLHRYKTVAQTDIMAHSGGALYFRRLLELVPFTNKILIEPACFLSGCSTATKQIYTYYTLNPLFLDPLVKNLPKLLDITETIILSNTKLDNTMVVLSAQDPLFQPTHIMAFIEKYHPHVRVFVLPNSAHGDAILRHAAQTVAIIKKQLGHD